MADEELDVLVVGGGVVGAGAALDAATRGLTVGLLERDDWASGTSSRSSRLAHGGLRYLEQLEFGLVREALGERGLLLDRLAPHLVRPLAFLLPLTRRGWERPYLGAGVARYDVLSRISRKGTALQGHQHLSRKSVARLAPALDTDKVVGAIGFHDAQIDDVRHTLALVRTAASRGALTASRVEVTGLLRADDRVVGVTATDRETGATVQVRAKSVLVATGVWSEQVDAWLGRPARGPGAAVDRRPPRRAAGTRSRFTPRSSRGRPRRSSSCCPGGSSGWSGRRTRPGPGTAPTRARPRRTSSTSSTRPTAGSPARSVGRRHRGVRRAPTAGGGGPRRGDAAEGAETTKLSREHVVAQPVPGLVTIAGGKYTTYRVMAADAVDMVAEDLGVPVPPSRTAYVLLAGASGFAEVWADRAELSRTSGLDLATVEHLLRRHGVAGAGGPGAGRRDPALGRRLHPEAPYLAAEIVHAVTHEDARHLDDLLVRRTRVALETRDGGRSVAEATARLVAPLLGWDEDAVADEVEAFCSRHYGAVPDRPRCCRCRCRDPMSEAETSPEVRDPRRARAFDRMVNFSDAVVAIAITLLVLPLASILPD